MIVPRALVANRVSSALPSENPRVYGQDVDKNRGNTDNAEATIAFTDLPIWEAATEALADDELLTATITELLERLTAGPLDPDTRNDIAVDLLAMTDRLRGFALLVQS